VKKLMANALELPADIELGALRSEATRRQHVAGIFAQQRRCFSADRPCSRRSCAITR
jgi:hypothetical protein